MQTNFTPEQLADPDIRVADGILRKCVHCGFCTATCPTFVLLGDERDSPRGRIYLIKDMLEKGRPASEADVRHIDRCLSCLACMTTCPSGVHYMHLVDQARAHIERTYDRPWHDRAMRALLAAILPYPRRFRAAVSLARLGKPLAGVLRAKPVARLGAMLALAPGRLPRPDAPPRPAVFPAAGERRKRVTLLTGCAQQVLAPSINQAAIRLLNRVGVEVVLAAGEGCCGALVHHMGREAASHAQAKANIDAWTAEIEGEGLDAIVITTSGCGTTVKDYGHMLREDAAYAEKAARVSALAEDISECLIGLDIGPPARRPAASLAYHSACSMQHGQQIRTEPKALLAAAGFTVKDVPEGHLCCGSAGVYNILQPAIATRLRERKVANIERTGADLIATGNIGCITQIAQGTARPIVHTVELLDWAYGGPLPAALAGHPAAFAERTAAPSELEPA
jgi:glycolate oxidase iron-sulfur subunit